VQAAELTGAQPHTRGGSLPAHAAHQIEAQVGGSRAPSFWGTAKFSSREILLCLRFLCVFSCVFSRVRRTAGQPFGCSSLVAANERVFCCKWVRGACRYPRTFSPGGPVRPDSRVVGRGDAPLVEARETEPRARYGTASEAEKRLGRGRLENTDALEDRARRFRRRARPDRSAVAFTLGFAHFGGVAGVSGVTPLGWGPRCSRVGGLRSRGAAHRAWGRGWFRCRWPFRAASRLPASRKSVRSLPPGGTWAPAGQADSRRGLVAAGPGNTGQRAVGAERKTPVAPRVG